jgi:DNA-binding CsgD family transcriptional regulator
MELQAAATAFDTCGALRRRRAPAAADRLRSKHRRSGRAADSRSVLHTLTGRELQVARLVVDRRTNAEIAAALFLSQKTVETHVRNLFHKLGGPRRPRSHEQWNAPTAAAQRHGSSPTPT